MTIAVSFFDIVFLMGRAGEMIFGPGRLKVVLGEQLTQSITESFFRFLPNIRDVKIRANEFQKLYHSPSNTAPRVLQFPNATKKAAATESASTEALGLKHLTNFPLSRNVRV